MLTPFTAGVLKLRPVAEGQAEAGPVMDAGEDGIPLKASVLAVLAPQALLATTDRVPLTKPDGMVMVMDVPVLGAAMLQPAGAVQV